MINITDESKEEKKTEKESNVRRGLVYVAIGVVGVGVYTYALGRKHGYDVGYSRGDVAGHAHAVGSLVDAINEYTLVQIERSKGGE